MNFSYWENKHIISKPDFTIIGAGITGLTTAIFLKNKFPDKKITILERGITPWGASSKNAGFACFGSMSEILADIDNVGLNETIELVEKRWKGLSELIALLGKDGIGHQNNGGHELFTPMQKELHSKSLNALDQINQALFPIFKEQVFSVSKNAFGFKGIEGMITNKFESQIDTGLMLKNLTALALNKGIQILNGAEVRDYKEENSKVEIELNGGMKLSTSRLILCVNGFASKFLEEDIKPARAQVLITKPIENLKIKGTFHMEEGYYYFRNIDDRILFGGGRNLDFDGETTTEMENTEQILHQLENYLKEVILPDQKFEVDYHWAGIMGVGSQKKPIIKALSDRVYCGVRLGGMGVAIGTLVGKELAEMIE
ncbi:MAG: FAD-binding oxidoreductase [Crocinitomicaceae bacterium]|nr:FAD-binding oxidoreductase [Crocinitomicaceae bacterium]